MVQLYLLIFPSYIGVVYHPFSNRQKVFVKYDLSAGFMWEIARTSDQLLTSFIIDSIQNNDDVLDRLILSFSKDISIDLNNNFKETYDKLYDGNPFETYHYFQVFRELTPAAYQKDINSYDGDFPSFINQLNISAIENASDLEINNRIDKNSVNQPPYWLKSENKKQLFDTYFNNNEFSKAWLTLNSSGWKCEEVKISLEKLKQKNNDDLFGLVADNWINNLYNKNEKEFIY